MDYEVDFFNRSFVVSFAKASSAAISRYHFDIIDWFRYALDTQLFDQYEYACDVYSQADTYIVNQFLEECEEKTNIKENSEFQSKHVENFCEVSYWMAYVFMSWKLTDGITGKYILNYDLEEIMYSYSALHTQSITYAVKTIKENYLIGCINLT